MAKFSYSFNETNYTGDFDSAEDAAAEAFADDPECAGCWVGENRY